MVWALRSRKEFTLWMLQYIALTIPGHVDDEKIYSRKIYLNKIVAEFCPQEADAILERYNEPVTADDEDATGLSNDEEMQNLMEELAITDQVNGSDMKTWKGDLADKAVKKLQKMRQNAQDKTKQERGARLKRRRELLAAKKAKKVNKRLKRMRPMRRTAPDAPVPPASGTPGPAAPPAAPPVPAQNPGGTGGQLVVEPPVLTGDWLRVHVEGGWVLWSASQKRLDSHCGVHAEKCRMNRGLGRGCIGLACAWLKAGDPKDPDGTMHDELKMVVSSATYFEERQACRRAFESLAEDRQPQAELVRQILAQETNIRGGDDSEPAWFNCQPTAAARAAVRAGAASSG